MKTTSKKTKSSTKSSSKAAPKSPSGKELSGRNPAKSVKSKPAAKVRSEKKSSVNKYPRKEIRIIVMILATIVLALSYYTKNSFGILGSIIKNIGFVFLGATAYILPVFLFVTTLHIFLKGTLSPHKHRYVFSAIGFMCISGLHTLYYYQADTEGLFSQDFFAVLDTIITSGRGCYSGGLIGALLSLPLKSLVSVTGAMLVLIALAVTCFVMATGVELITTAASSMANALIRFIKNLQDERRQVTDDEEAEDDIKINGIPKIAEAPGKKSAPKASPSEKEQGLKQAEKTESTDFKINFFQQTDENKEEANLPGTVEIPEDIEKQALEASGGIKEEKIDNTPIAVTEDEIDTDYINYTFPPIDLLMKDKSGSGGADRPEDLRTQAKKLVDTLHSFGVEAKVLEVSKGPSVTRFELQPSAGVKVSKIVNLADDIALNLAAFGVRIEAPIPGKAAVGIEIPNKTTSMVCLRDVIDSPDFKNYKSKTAFAMGKDISGNPVISDISKMPHMLIAGATGSGKSVCINSLITSILYKADPNEVKLILIDPKVVELGVYNGIPHLLIPVVTDPRRAAGALNWAVQEMVKRYRLFADTNVRDLKGYNEYAAINGERQLEQIIIIIDELADLMMVSPHEVEDSICRLAQMARAAGMHLVIATQRPSVDVITGLIKANVPSRIAFSVSSQIDSRTILDMGGAEKLLGKGDMLFLPMGASKPKRVQGAFVSDKEVEKIVEFVKSDFNAHYNEDIIEHIENGTSEEQSTDSGDWDELLPQAIEIVVELGQASASLLQRKLKVGYSRAGRLIDQLEERKVIGPHEGSKPRKVLMSKTEFQEMTLALSEE